MGSSRKIVVLGVGNTLLTDEAVGVMAVNELSKMDFPDNVEFMDGGTAGYSLIPMIENAAKVIVVDAVDARAKPGTMYRFTPEDVEKQGGKPIPRFSIHEVGLMEALQLAKLTGNQSEIIVFGIQPKSLDWGTELTPELQEKLPRLLELVSEEIRNSLQEEVV